MTDQVTSSGWCAPTVAWVDPYASLSPEQLAAERARLAGGGPCDVCGGIGKIVHKCDCDCCEVERETECWNCTDGVVDDRTFLLDLTPDERQAYLDPFAQRPVELPTMSVVRGGLVFPCAAVDASKI